MNRVIGNCKNNIAALELTPGFLTKNTLILGEEGSGKTNLGSKIRDYVIANGIPTLYMDFSNPEADGVEARYKDENFNYLRFEESDAFNAAFDAMIAERKNIYLAIDPNYFSNSREQQSRLSEAISKRTLLDNYYYFFHEIAHLNGFYTKFEDFLQYLFGMINMKKFGMSFLTQPNEIFEDAQLKLLFSYLFLGRCSNANYYNTSALRSMPRNTFFFQYRKSLKTLLFNDITGQIVVIDE